MFLIPFIAILFSVFFDIELSELCFVIFGLFAIVSIFLEGDVSLVTNFNYENYIALHAKYEGNALRTVVRIRAFSAIVAIFAIFVYGVDYVANLNLDCVDVGLFVLNVCSYVKYLNAEYFLRHDYVR